MQSVIRVFVAGFVLLFSTNAWSQVDVAVQRSGEPTSLLLAPARLEIEHASMADALTSLSKSSGVPLAFSPSIAGRRGRVSCSCLNQTVAQALGHLLRGTAFTYMELADLVVIIPPLERRIDAMTPRLASQAGLLAKARAIATADTEADDGADRIRVGTIVGRVTEAGTDNSVVNAQALVDGAGRAITDSAGRYRIEDVPTGRHAVAVTSIGFRSQTQEVQVDDGATITVDFSLDVQATALDELVVTVTGEQRRRELGHTVGKIDAQSIVGEAPVNTLGDVLAGRVAGVQVIYNGAVSGSSPKIRIRGQNSFTLSNDPLLYIDGVRVANSPGDEGPVFDAAGRRAGWGSGRLNDLSPEEIESIEVVKGPSAATLYGTDAANGVILVRTKKGVAGRTTWRAHAEWGRLDTPMKGHFRPSYRSWGTTPDGSPTHCVLAAAATGTCGIDSVTAWNPLSHPETTPLGIGTRGKYGLQVSGGAAQLRYFLSADYEQETGPLEMPAAEQERIASERGGAAIPHDQVRPNHLQKVRLRSTGTAELGSTADVSLSTGLVTGSSRIPHTTIFSSGLWNAGYRDANDGWGLGRPGEVFAVTGTEDVLHSTSSAMANWRPWPWLQTRATAGLDFSTTEWNGLQRRGEGPFGVHRNGRRVTQRTNLRVYSADLGATVSAALGVRASSRTSVGLQYHRQTQRSTNVAGSELAPGSETVTSAAVVTGAEETLETIVAGAYVEQMVGLAERLFLTAAVRADGGSTFGKGFTTALYPKASLSWLALENPDQGVWLTSLRPRVAYGASGVQPSPTAALAIVGLSSVFVDGAATTGGQLASLGNPNLRPERTAELEAGVDMAFWRDRVRLEATYYRRRSTDALVNVPLAVSTGLGSRQENIGEVQNHGFEVLLNAQLVAIQSASWDVAVNGSTNTNRLARLAPGVIVSPFQGFRNVPGYPLGGLWARPILGYSDANGDGILTDDEVTVGDTLVSFGSSVPRHVLGVSSTLSLFGERLRIATQFDYRGGYKNMDFTGLTACIRAVCRGVNDQQAPLGEQAAAVALRSVAFGQTWAGYVKDGSYLRWRELSVTYAVPLALARRFGAETASITFAGRNLGLWTRFGDGIDPEADASPISDTIALNPAAPLTRYLIVRLNLAF